MFAWFEAFVAWLHNWLQELGELITQLTGELVGLAAGLVFYVLAWVIAALDPIFRRIFWHVGNMFADLMSLVPAPAWLSALQAKWDAVPWSTIGYFADPLQFEYGFTVVFASMLLKFGLRWLPFVGRAFRAASH